MTGPHLRSVLVGAVVAALLVGTVSGGAVYASLTDAEEASGSLSAATSFEGVDYVALCSAAAHDGVTADVSASEVGVGADGALATVVSWTATGPVTQLVYGVEGESSLYKLSSPDGSGTLTAHDGHTVGGRTRTQPCPPGQHVAGAFEWDAGGDRFVSVPAQDRQPPGPPTTETTDGGSDGQSETSPKGGN